MTAILVTLPAAPKFCQDAAQKVTPYMGMCIHFIITVDRLGLTAGGRSQASHSGENSRSVTDTICCYL